MYKVIGSPRNRTFRVVWMLEELGQDYEIVVAKAHSDVIRQGNPGGKAPVLQDGDAVITDSVAIICYLSDKHGACTHPAGSLARGRQDALTQFCVDEVEGALWTAAKNTFVNPEDQRCSDVVPVCKFEFAKAMVTLEAQLGAQDFVAGNEFTVPDLLFGHCAGWAKNAKFDLPGGIVGAYFERMRSRPAFVRAGQRADAAIEAAD